MIIITQDAAPKNACGGGGQETYKPWPNSKLELHHTSGFADSAKTGNSTKLELHHIVSLDLLICKNRESAKPELHNTVSVELPHL